MPDYRRAYARGGSYFFTVVTYERRALLTQPAVYARLREAFRHVGKTRPFAVDAIVVLPDHLHCIWRLPADDEDFSTRWRLIKHFVARGVKAEANTRAEKPVWQRRFWEHRIRDEDDWRRHMDYIFFNPIKHGYVERVSQWPFSSFERAVARGWYAMEWGAVVPESVRGMDLE